MATKPIFVKKFKMLEKQKLVSIVGCQWGDEGKGKIIDTIASNFDIVARYNGGANAGHTVYVDDKKFSFHLLPCGILYDKVINVIGNGVVLDFEVFEEELNLLKKEKINCQNNLILSDRAHLLFGFHKILDSKIENILENEKLGTTKRGIGPCYAFKSARFGLRLGDLVHNFDSFAKKYRNLLRLVQNCISFEYDGEKELSKLSEFRELIKSNVRDTSLFLYEALNNNKRVLAEGANATMLDINFGSYPFVTSSFTGNNGIFNGLGIPPTHKLYSIGVAKAYTTRVGEGPFPTEITAPVGDAICEKGGEYGTTTGRKRRIGWIDIPVISYSIRLNGFDAINLTKLDILSDLDEIKLGVRYVMNSQPLRLGEYPSTLDELKDIVVEYETFPGWKCDISNIVEYKQLPENTRKYVERIEELIEMPIRWIGVGKNRGKFIYK